MRHQARRHVVEIIGRRSPLLAGPCSHFARPQDHTRDAGLGLTGRGAAHASHLFGAFSIVAHVSGGPPARGCSLLASSAFCLPSHSRTLVALRGHSPALSCAGRDRGHDRERSRLHSRLSSFKHPRRVETSVMLPRFDDHLREADMMLNHIPTSLPRSSAAFSCTSRSICRSSRSYFRRS